MRPWHGAGDASAWLNIRLQGHLHCPSRRRNGTLHPTGTATSPSTQLRMWRSLGASASVLGLEGAAGYLYSVLGAARRSSDEDGIPSRPGQARRSRMARSACLN